jgi:type VI secretion system protein
MQQSLFESITGRFADGTPLDAVAPDERRLRSVTDHLWRLFNTREGSLSHLKGYGLPDISDVYRRMPDAAEELRRAVVATVERYEPRLRKVKAIRRDDAAATVRLEFTITAELVGAGQVRFQTTFSPSGSATIAPWKRTGADL